MSSRLALLGALAATALAGQALADARMPPAMIFTGIQPSSAAPGEQVTIQGLQFMPGARVWLGRAEAKEVKVETAQRIVATVPDHPPGKVSVMIRNPDGREVSRARSFTYVGR